MSTRQPSAGADQDPATQIPADVLDAGWQEAQRGMSRGEVRRILAAALPLYRQHVLHEVQGWLLELADSAIFEREYNAARELAAALPVHREQAVREVDQLRERAERAEAEVDQLREELAEAERRQAALIAELEEEARNGCGYRRGGIQYALDKLREQDGEA